MPLRDHGNRLRNPWRWCAVLLILALAIIGFGSTYDSGALAQPAAVIKAAKKGGPPAKQVIAPKAVIPGNKAALPKAPNIPGAAPKSFTAKGPDASTLPKGPGPQGALPKGPGPQGALPKGPNVNPNLAAFPKGAAPKSFGPTALPNRFGPGGIGPKGVGPRGPLTSPHFAATAPQRLQLRADHRLALFNAQRLVPRMPFPGERGFTGVPPAGETRFVSTELVLHMGPNVSRQAVDNSARQLGLDVISAEEIGITGGTIFHFRVGGGRQVAEVVRTLETQNIGTPQPNYTYRLFQEAEPAAAAAAPTAQTEPQQYVVGKLNLEEAHKIATGNNVLVAVIDSAIDATHPDLTGSIVEQYDATGRNEKPHLHGTGMTGAIAAHQRLMGIAPKAKVLAVRAFTTGQAQSPEATTRNILNGMDWAIKKGARIINMSFAGPYDPMLQVAMKNARAKGVVLIAASGNYGPKSPPLYPAADPNVIAVTATDENDQVFAQAVRGPHLAVAAPGVDVIVPAPEQTYQLTTGTSVAAAHVSGVAALLIERYPTASVATILEVLTASAKRLSPKGRDDLYGWGLVDAAAALAELDSRMADGQVATVARPTPPAVTPAAFPKSAAPKQPLAPRPASTPVR